MRVWYYDNLGVVGLTPEFGVWSLEFGVTVSRAQTLFDCKAFVPAKTPDLLSK